MEIKDIPFQLVDLEHTPPSVHPGQPGTALWKTVQQGNVRMRIVEYSPGYVADHWCQKGHAVFVLEGEFETERTDGRRFQLRAGMGYRVADGQEAHLSRSPGGVKLLIVD